MKLDLKKLFVFSFIVKIFVAWVAPVILDEYYYFIWGQYLSLSYFDHPPMVGWMMALSQPLRVFGEGAIRWPFVILSHCTVGIWLLILKPRLSSERLFWFLAIAVLNPLWGLGAIIATPDIPLLFFWSLATFFSLRILSEGKFVHYLGFGASLGFGFLSKYQIVLFIPCLLILIVQQKAYKKIFNWKTLVSVVVAGLICTPVFLWNYFHDWSSFNFQWNHGMNAPHWKWFWPLEYVSTQILIVFPCFLFFLFAKKKSWLKDPLLPFIAFPFLFFLYSSFKGRVEGNWVIMAYPAIYAVSIMYSGDGTFQWIKRCAGLWAFCLILVLGTIPFQNIDLLKKVSLYEAKKFKPVLKLIDSNTHYLTYSYQLSAYLTFKTGRLFCRLPNVGRVDHFHFINECQKVPKKFVFITEKWNTPVFDKIYPGYKESLQTPVNDHYKFIEVVK